jgi:hypothetical protein
MSIIELDYLYIKIVSIKDVINYFLFLCARKHKDEWEGKQSKMLTFLTLKIN